jgi:hypothetical protein
MKLSSPDDSETNHLLGVDMKDSKFDLSQFYGTENYYKTCLFSPNLKHTDGVQYFAEQAGAFWFLDIIATEVYPLTKKEPFLSIKMTVINWTAQITVENGDLKTLKTKKIEYTDCPQGLYEFFLTDDVLMLTSEY